MNGLDEDCNEETDFYCNSREDMLGPISMNHKNNRKYVKCVKYFTYSDNFSTCIVNGVVVFPMENRCPSTVHTETPNADRSYLYDFSQI